MNIKELCFKEDKKFEDYYNIKNNDTYLLINKGLTSLEGLPEDFNSDLHIEYNNLKNLKYLPENFNSELWLQNNNLKTLKGLPKNFNNIIYLNNNPIETLNGLNNALDPRNIIGLNEKFVISEYQRFGKAHLLI